MTIIICYFFPFLLANWPKLLPVDDQTGPSFIFLRYNPCSLHTRLGLHSWKLQAGLPGEQHRLLWAGPDGPLHNLSPDQLSAAASGWEPAGCPAQRHLSETQETPWVCQTHDAFMDDPRSEREGTLCGLPLQRHRWELGEEAARLGDADGQFVNRGRY